MAYGPRAQQALYRRLPPWLRDWAATYYAVRTYRTRFGPHFHAELARLKEHERLPDEELERIQLEGLRTLIDRACRTVPYYRSLCREKRLDPAGIGSLDDLRAIPLLDKATIRTRHGDLLADGADTSRLVCVHTSGTTGTPLDLYQTRRFFQLEYASWWFHRSWAGVHLGDRTATLAGHPVVPTDQQAPPFWVRNHRENQMIFSSYHMSRGNLRYYREALERFRPEFVHGYPSSIYLAALQLNDDAVTTVRPKAVFTSSETILEHQRTEIERAFGCRVFSYYGNAERAGYLAECEEGSFHALAEHSIVEFLGDDGEPVAPGTPGRLVCTNINDTVMPLVRYVTGDVAIPLPPDRKCPCGRGGRLVASVLGRVEDYVVTPEGRYVGRLDHIFKGVSNVAEAQIYQPSRERIVVRIVRDAAFGSKDEDALTRNARERLGSSIAIAVEYVDHIERTPAGKFRFIVSDVPLEERLRISR